MAELLITGATGFVGSHLVEAVARRGLRASALVRETSDTALLERFGVERVVGDIGDPRALRRAIGDAHTVLHLAAATRALGPDTFHRVNAGGTERLVDAMLQAGGSRRLVYLSTLAAVGPTSGSPVEPDDSPRPLTAYGRSKLEGERTALSANDLSVAVLRPPAVYGPRDRDLLTFFRLANRGILPLVGPRTRRLQLIHAADLANAVLDAAPARTATGVFHVAEPTAYTWDQVLDRVALAVGRKGVRVRVPDVLLKAAAATTEMASRLLGRPAILDRDKAREVLAPGWECETDSAYRGFGFRASTPLERGLRETAEWYRAYGWL